MPYRATRNPWWGPGLTAATLVCAEVVRDLAPHAPLVAVTLLILALVPVAYSALATGFWVGLSSAVLVALYTLHYSSTTAFFTPTVEVISGGVVMLVIGLGTVIPMSLLRRREQRLIAALEARAIDLAARNAELTDAIGALEAFGFVVSHDLKEPVRAIENYLDAAREEYAGPAEGRTFLDEAYEANRRLYRLLEGLLAYSRASTLATTTRELDVRAVLQSESCRLQYGRVVEEKGVTLHVDDPLPIVMGDEVILAQLLGNLLLNAARHNRSAHPMVRVRSEPFDARAGLAHLVVEDNGPGFPPDVISRFSELKSTRPATVKGGFGLVIAYRAAHRLGGTLRIETSPGGKGARVHVLLPGKPSPSASL